MARNKKKNAVYRQNRTRFRARTNTSDFRVAHRGNILLADVLSSVLLLSFVSFFLPVFIGTAGALSLALLFVGAGVGVAARLSAWLFCDVQTCFLIYSLSLRLCRPTTTPAQTRSTLAQAISSPPPLLPLIICSVSKGCVFSGQMTTAKHK